MAQIKKALYTLNLNIYKNILAQMSTIYIGKFRYTSMINSTYKFETLVWRLNKRLPKLALSYGGSRGNMES